MKNGNDYTVEQWKDAFLAAIDKSDLTYFQLYAWSDAVVLMETYGVPMMKEPTEEQMDFCLKGDLVRKTRSKKTPYMATNKGVAVLELTETGRAYLELGKK